MWARTSRSSSGPRAPPVSPAACCCRPPPCARRRARRTTGSPARGTGCSRSPPTTSPGLQVLVRSVLAGTSPTVLAPGPFRAAAFAAAVGAMAAAGPRYTSLVPTQLVRLLDDDAATDALRSFDGVLLGGAAAPPDLLTRARAAGVAVVTHVRHDRDVRRVRLRRAPARRGRRPARRRRSDPAGRPGPRRRLPGPPRPRRRRVRAGGRGPAPAHVGPRGLVRRRARGARPRRRRPGQRGRQGRARRRSRRCSRACPGSARCASSACPTPSGDRPSSRSSSPAPAAAAHAASRSATAVADRLGAAHAPRRPRGHGLAPRARAGQDRPSGRHAARRPPARRGTPRDDCQRLAAGCTPADPAGRRRPGARRHRGGRPARRGPPRTRRARARRRARPAGRRQLRERLLRRHPRHRRRPGRSAAADRLRDARSPGTVKAAAFAAFGLAALLGLALVAIDRPLVAARRRRRRVVAAWGYTGGRRPYGYRGLGEVGVFVFFGLVAVLGTTYTQADELSWPAVGRRRVRRHARVRAAHGQQPAGRARPTPSSASGPSPCGMGERWSRRAYAVLVVGPVLLGGIGVRVRVAVDADRPAAPGAVGRPGRHRAARRARQGPGPGPGRAPACSSSRSACCSASGWRSSASRAASSAASSTSASSCARLPSTVRSPAARRRSAALGQLPGRRVPRAGEQHVGQPPREERRDDDHAATCAAPPTRAGRGRRRRARGAGPSRRRKARSQGRRWDLAAGPRRLV